MKKEKTYSNVFDALGFDKEESQSLRIRSELILQIKDISKDHGYSQHDLSKILDVPQPRVSELMTGKIEKFSTDKLINFLSKMGHRITIHSAKERRSS